MEINTNQKKGGPKGLVEDALGFSISSISGGLFRGSEKKSGKFFLDPLGLLAEYQITKKDGAWTFHLLDIEGFKNFRTREIGLEGVPVTFGTRPYFHCPSCGSLRHKLHLGEHGRIACRECLNLTYQSTRDSHGEPIFRLLRRYMKLRMKQAEISRIVYNERPTRKVKSVMHMAEKWLPG